MASTLYVTRTKSHCDCCLYDNSMMEVKKRRDRVVTAEEQCGYSTIDFTMSVQKTLASLYSIFWNFLVCQKLSYTDTQIIRRLQSFWRHQYQLLIARNGSPGCWLPTWLIVSVLVIDAYLSKPWIYSQHFHFFSTSKLIFLPHFSSFFSYPV